MSGLTSNSQNHQRFNSARIPGFYTLHPIEEQEIFGITPVSGRMRRQPLSAAATVHDDPELLHR
jgi:hypothetical protein